MHVRLVRPRPELEAGVDYIETRLVVFLEESDRVALVRPIAGDARHGVRDPAREIRTAGPAAGRERAAGRARYRDGRCVGCAAQ